MPCCLNQWPALKTHGLFAGTNAGRLLLLPASELPMQNSGRGNQIINLPRKQRQEPKGERVNMLTAITEQQTLVLFTSNAHRTLRFKDLLDYQGTRGNRGSLLSKSWRNYKTFEIRDV